MAARKLQTEIDRTLKKVTEGVELFESIYDKMQNSTNQTQKEKLETDLKTQIKKLQRLRDQIKAWVASNDIKDKSALLDNRRLIETQMEKFKACEKEMKTKAFSKEGLTAAAKLDPKAQEKLELTTWIQTQVEELQLQMEQSEAEIETLQGGGKKKGKSGGATVERLEELEHRNERRKWHIGRLEIIMRLLDNGSMATEKVKALQDDVQYFVESNTADEEFEEDEGIYDELNLDEEEEKWGFGKEDEDLSDSEEGSEPDFPPRTPLKKYEEDSPSSSKRDGSPILKKAPATLQLRKGSTAADTKPPPNPNFAQQPMSSILKAGLPPQPRPPAALPSIRYAAAAAGAVSQSNSSNNNTASHIPPTTPNVPNLSIPPSAPSVSSSSGPGLSQDQSSGAPSSPSLTHPSVTSPMLSSASANQPDDSLYSVHDSPAMSEAPGAGPIATSSPQRSGSRMASVSSPLVGSQSQAQSPNPSHVLSTDSPIVSQPQVNGSSQQQTTLPPQQQQPVPSPLPQQVQQFPSTISTSQPQPPQYPPGVKVSQISADQMGVQSHNVQQLPSMPVQRPPSTAQQQVPQQLVQQQQPRASSSSAFPGSLSDLVVSFESVKQKAAQRMSNLDQVHKLLEGGYSSAPQPQDTDKPKYYTPRNPYHTPSYYPQTPLAILNTAGIFSQLDVETLFYIFYFHPGTYQQYLSAKELKRQSWRFHVKYLTWFQRHSEPQAITDEYEQGVYVYFDWEGSWCQRKKSDFRFEYRYLSED